MAVTRIPGVRTIAMVAVLASTTLLPMLAPPGASGAPRVSSSTAQQAPTSWRQTPVRGYDRPDGALRAIACPASDLCFAARSSEQNDVLRWNGTTWTTSGTFPISGPASLALSCASRTFCLATARNSFGDSAALVWNGQVWRTTGTPPSTIGQLSCPSRSACYAAMSEYDGTHVLRWTADSWTSIAVPPILQDNRALVSGLSCSAAQDCFVVGSVLANHNNGRRKPLALHWDGSGWVETPVPVPADAVDNFAELYDVSCVSATFCAAVGRDTAPDADSRRPLAEIWDGSGWTPRPAPDPPTGDDRYSIVDCDSPSFCVATGVAENTPHDAVQGVAQWDGTAWSAQPDIVVAPQTKSRVVSDLACAGDACLAVGSALSAADRFTYPLADRFTDGAWSIVHVPPTRVGFPAELSDVSCVAADWCDAVGWTDREDSSVAHVLVEHWDGRRWHLVPSPDPGTTMATYLSGISCTSRAFCLAVGRVRAVAAAPLVEQWDGTAWSVVSPPDTDDGLRAVACTSPVFCVATSERSLFVRRGQAWSATTTLPTRRALAAVDCVAPTDCTAVGLGGSGRNRPLIVQWDGRRWRTTLQQVSADISDARLFDVDCPARGHCLLVGAQQTSRRGYSPLAYAWDGAAASRLRPPLGAPQSNRSLTGVSCPAVDACVSVGFGGLGSEPAGEVPVVLTFDAGEWTEVPTTAPRDTVPTEVSCAATDDCIAIERHHPDLRLAAMHGTA